MPRLEKDFQTLFTKWVKHRFTGTAAFELKVTDGSSIPFSFVKEHQVNALLAARTGKMSFKIPDDSYGEKPFDFFQIEKGQAFVVVMFNCRERGQKQFFMIDILKWIEEVKISERKSLTVDRAREIGQSCHLA